MKAASTEPLDEKIAQTKASEEAKREGREEEKNLKRNDKRAKRLQKEKDEELEKIDAAVVTLQFIHYCDCLLCHTHTQSLSADMEASEHAKVNEEMASERTLSKLSEHVAHSKHMTEQALKAKELMHKAHEDQRQAVKTAMKRAKAQMVAEAKEIQAEACGFAKQ
ncbi:unnamed protein product [Vitrella brassicaformis CCMP3155]|uniref:Uncharacterized protein n=1 Tax=Vitrella brassicaformis (strain CCMP3155) TaxID=1169540 RepID=A0A0G4GWA8_VITBC|nr:unnamed protein product [Vitrella brassicaformis CCMP3155]|eukprot:CEM35025.1 unnamed protein product [Vitrella brassicaformis CCMP3155]